MPPVLQVRRREGPDHQLLADRAVLREGEGVSRDGEEAQTSMLHNLISTEYNTFKRLIVLTKIFIYYKLVLGTVFCGL